MISSQCIYFQCVLLCPRSIYEEEIVAIVPTVDYGGLSEKYINHQLTLAITAALATGILGIVQIFMTSLDRTLETKVWCSRDSSEPEVSLRRELLIWTLSNLLRRLKCREKFTDNTSSMFDYPRALLWAVKDYKEAHLYSWIIQYPLIRKHISKSLPNSECCPSPRTSHGTMAQAVRHRIVIRYCFVSIKSNANFNCSAGVQPASPMV